MLVDIPSRRKVLFVKVRRTVLVIDAFMCTLTQYSWGILIPRVSSLLARALSEFPANPCFSILLYVFAFCRGSAGGIKIKWTRLLSGYRIG